MKRRNTRNRRRNSWRNLRGTYVELMQETANVSNELKYLERQYTQETAKNQQSVTRFEALRDQLEELTEQQSAAQTKTKTLEAQLTEEQEHYRRLAEEKKRGTAAIAKRTAVNV